MRNFPAGAILSVFLAVAPATLAATAGPPAARGPTVRTLAKGGPLEICDGDKLVLRYNYQVVSEPPETRERVKADNRRYAVARSDYIHPLCGLHGEVLTEDWPPAHPHHRGIYWGWPEVDWNGKRGDLHALQQIFARPTGQVRTEQNAEFAQIEAENLWQWEDRTPIVREEARIRAYRQTEPGRAIDLSFRCVAVGDDVQVARRTQIAYGGLNIRLAPVAEQKIVTFSDPAGTAPRRAWALRSGSPRGGTSVVGLTILQNRLNPDYPGDWVQFPELSWIQPTFPASGTRFTISKTRPLELSYRLWIHDKKVGPELIHGLWADYNNLQK